MRVKQGHIHLQETLADDVLALMIAHPNVRAARVSTEKPYFDGSFAMSAAAISLGT